MVATHGREALEKAAADPPDLVVLDYVMPVLDGAATLQELRADERLAVVPVVLVSGMPESMVQRRCRDFDAFLQKPFSLDELLATIERLLAARRRRRRR